MSKEKFLKGNLLKRMTLLCLFVAAIFIGALVLNTQELRRIYASSGDSWSVTYYDQAETDLTAYSGTTDLTGCTAYIEGTGLTLPAPIKFGYDFVGWFTTYDGAVSAEIITANESGDKAFYAKWTEWDDITVSTNGINFTVNNIYYGESYDTINEIISAVSDGNTIVFEAQDSSGSLAVNEEIILSNRTLTLTGRIVNGIGNVSPPQSTLRILASSNITLQDFYYHASYTGSSQIYLVSLNYSTLTIKGGTFTNAKNSHGFVIQSSTLNIYGGSINIPSWGVCFQSGANELSAVSSYSAIYISGINVIVSGSCDINIEKDAYGLSIGSLDIRLRATVNVSDGVVIKQSVYATGTDLQEISLTGVEGYFALLNDNTHADSFFSAVNCQIGDAVEFNAVRTSGLIIFDSCSIRQLSFGYYDWVSQSIKQRVLFNILPGGNILLKNTNIFMGRQNNSQNFIKMGKEDESVSYRLNYYNYEEPYTIANYDFLSAGTALGAGEYYLIYPYTISYTLNGGSLATANPTSYDGSVTILLNSPTKTGYMFDGWYDNQEYSGDYVTQIAQGSSGNKTYWAKWTEKAGISITETAQAAVAYSGNAIHFTITGYNSDLENYTAEYYDNGVWVGAPTNAGSYNVKITRAEDAAYKAYEIIIINGLVISKASLQNNGAVTNYNGVYDGTAHGLGYNENLIVAVNDQTVTCLYSTDTFTWFDSITYIDFTDGEKTVYWKISAANHYDLTGSGTVDISKRTVTVTAHAKSSVHKAELVALTYTVSPELISGDNFTGTLSTTANKAVVAESDITQGTLSAGSNYAVSFAGAKYTVTPKETVFVTQTPQSFIYDGSAKAFAITGTELTGFTVEYYINDTYTQTAPANAGSYKVRITRAEDTDSYAFSAEIAGGLVVDLQKVSKPAPDSTVFIYTGGIQTYTLTSDLRYTVTNNMRTDAGSQTVTAALNDKNNYEWEDETTADLTFTFTIGKAAAEITVDQTEIIKTYGDNWILPVATTNFGTVICDKTVSEMAGANSYTVTFSVVGTDNYNGDSKQLSVTVNRQHVSKPAPDNTVFIADGTQKTYAITTDGRYTVNGNIKILHGTYTVTVALNDKTNYEWADGTATDLSFVYIIRQPQLTDKIDVNADKDDVIVTAGNGFAPEVVVHITVLPEVLSAPYNASVEKYEKINKIYDIKLLINGVPTQPEGTITLKILIPTECRGNAFRLLHMHNDQVTVVNYTVDGEYLTFTTGMLSEFVFVIDNTGSILWLIILLTIIFIAEIALAAYQINKNKKTNKAVKTHSFMPMILAVFIPVWQTATVISLGVLCVAMGLYNIYLYLFKNRPDTRQDNYKDKLNIKDEFKQNNNDYIAATTPVAVIDIDKAQNTAAPVMKNDQTESGDDEETEVFKGVEEATGLAVIVRYRKSFTAKLIQSTEETKKYYGELKNAVLSYKKTSSRISWNYDSINSGKSKLAKFNVRGKTLYFYLMLNPDDYAETKYKVERAESKKYRETPCLYKIKNERRAKYALDLIAALAEKFGLVKGDSQNENYYLPYETTEALTAKKLIKELITKEKYEQWQRRQKQSELDSKKRIFVSVSEANKILSDETAAALIVEKGQFGYFQKKERSIVNIDSIAANFSGGDTVNLQTLRDKGLIAKNANYLKVLARGTLDKLLTVEANEFSIEAVKMILLTGGRAIKLK